MPGAQPGMVPSVRVTVTSWRASGESTQGSVSEPLTANGPIAVTLPSLSGVALHPGSPRRAGRR